VRKCNKVVMPMAILTRPEFNIPFISGQSGHSHTQQIGTALTTSESIRTSISDTDSFPVSRHNSRVGDEDLSLDNSVSPTTSMHGKDSKPRGLSSLPRLVHALSYGHLPMSSGNGNDGSGNRPSSFDFETDSPRTVSQAATDTTASSHVLSAVFHNPDDSRRPSYASMMTRSSQGSRISQSTRYDDSIGPNDSTAGSPPTHGQTSLPQSLDPSELSLITNFSAALSSDNQPYNPTKVTYPSPVSLMINISQRKVLTRSKYLTLTQCIMNN
jgi:hypothetical protein